MSRKPFFILMIGDDGAVLVPPKISKSSQPVFAPNHDEGKSILDALARHRRVPVLILADTLAQAFRRDTLPRLGYFDKQKLIERRLQHYFPAPAHTPHTQLTAALSLKNNAALLMCLHDGGPVALWLKRLAALRNTFLGVTLLPLESAGMVTRLMPEAKKGWGLLISWQRTGGFRQIVTRDGELIFTRLTPPLPFTAEPANAVKTLTLDIQATLGYLARLGLTESAPLHIAAVMPSNLHEQLTAFPLPVQKLVALTPHKAAFQLGLPYGPAKEDPSGDLLHAAWLQKRSKPRLILIQEDKRQTERLARVKRWGKKTAAFVWLLTLFLLGSEGHEIFRRVQTIRQSTAEVAILQSQLTQEKNRLGPVTEPLGRLQQAIERRRIFTAPAPVPWPLLTALEKGLGDAARIIRLEWQSGKRKERDETIGLSLRLTSPAPVTAKESLRQFTVQQFDKIAGNLRLALPDYNAKIARYPFPASPAETLSNTDGKELPSSLVADFEITRRQP